MKKIHIRDRIPKELYDDLYSRKKTVREVAKLVGVSENYLSHAIPERAPKRNPELLKAVRKLYKTQVIKEVLSGKMTRAKGAELAYVSERTFYRLIAKHKAEAQQ